MRRRARSPRITAAGVFPALGVPPPSGGVLWILFASGDSSRLYSGLRVLDVS